MNSKIFTTILAFFIFANFAFCVSAKDYIAFPIEATDEAGVPNGTYCHAWIYAKTPEDSDKIKSAVCEIISLTNRQVLSNYLRIAKDRDKARKFLNITNLDSDTINSKSICLKLGEYYVLVFPAGLNMRKGMNFFALKKSDDKYFWDPSFNDSLMTLIARSDIANVSKVEDVKTIATQDEKTLENLIANDLPFIVFQNGALVSCQEIEGINDTPIAKFYRNAQNIFYDWKLDEYASFMTFQSREAFNSQFASMSEADRKKILGDYFAWKKKYLRAADAGEFNIIFFTRIKEGATPYNDTAYIIHSEEKFLITKFSAQKSALDMFISTYILKNDGYFANISKKYLK